jgi:hypothetical protein
MVSFDEIRQRQGCLLSSSVGVDFPDHKEERSEVVERDERGEVG